MQKLLSLTEMRSEFDSGKFDRKILEGLIFQYLLDNFERYRLFNGNRERWIEFVSWLYPRLSRAVDYYRETGTSFDTYISSIIQWSSKEYKAREAEHRTIEYACWKERAQEMHVGSPEPGYYDEPAIKKKLEFPLTNISERQILILFLKSYYFVSREFLEKVAKYINMEPEELQRMVDKLHDLRARKEERIFILQERIFSQYYRCLTFQKRLSMTMPETARHEKLKLYIDRAQKRYITMKDRYSRLRTEASNKQISEILNIPKGTVDSALHAVREKWNITKKFDAVRVPLAENKNEVYHEPCSVTGTASMQAIPQMS